MIRVFDTLAELRLIDSQLWQEHIIFASAVIERGDAYIQQKAKNRDRVRKHREKQKTSHVSNALQPPCNQLQPSCNAPVTTNTDPDSDSDPDSYSQKEDADRSQKEPSVASYFKKAKHPSQLMDERFKRGTSLEVWEVATNKPDPQFIDWIVTHNKQGNSTLPPKTMAARMLYNSRDQGTNLAALMWQEYQESLQHVQQVLGQSAQYALSADDIDELRKQQFRN